MMAQLMKHLPLLQLLKNPQPPHLFQSLLLHSSCTSTHLHLLLAHLFLLMKLKNKSLKSLHPQPLMLPTKSNLHKKCHLLTVMMIYPFHPS
ncbi:hypothetical protein U1Q18_052431 [Sarracenia purpurea var. burkii]